MEKKTNPLWKTVLTVLVTMLFTSILFYITKPQRGNAVELLPAPTPESVIVDIFGAVVNPGVYTLSPNSRIYEAIKIAGGLLEDAYTGHLNQAAHVIDGQKIEIPLLVKNEEEYYTIGEIDQAASDPTGLININSASVDELVELPNIGETRAKAIIDYRNLNGPFTIIDDVVKVSGIGEITLNLIKDLITIYSDS
jgi:competence protein ComEA